MGTGIKERPRRDIERMFGNLLRAGVIIAAAVVLAGAVLLLAEEGAQTVGYGLFRAEPECLSSVPGILKSALSLQPRGIVQFGLLLLIATPVARVAFAAFAFGLRRDGVYVVITLIVLAVLLYGLRPFA
jgi:uncharacterized membrane protein